LRRGGADKVQDFRIAVEGFAGPVLGDFREEAVFDGIPFRGAGGIVGDGDRELVTVGELGLEFGFPGAGAATIAAAGVGQNQELVRSPDWRAVYGDQDVYTNGVLLGTSLRK
jgi:hypothetical protein